MSDRPTPPGIRASDADRERIARILRAAAGEGLLTLEETDERLASAYAAQYRRDLDPLTLDLPDGGRRLIDEPRDPAAASRLTWHAITVALIATVLVGAWVASGAHFFWPIFPIGFLLLSVVRHARWSGGHRPPWAHYR